MRAKDLAALHARIGVKRDQLSERLQKVAAAAADTPSDDEDADIMIEALFLRRFTLYEEMLERLFLHYVAGGSLHLGIRGTSFLSITDDVKARRLVRAGFTFLNWSKPAHARAMAANYLDRGWPLVDMLGVSADTLSDCANIRNRIAH